MSKVLGQDINQTEPIQQQIYDMWIPRFSSKKKFDPINGNLTSDRGWGSSIRCCQDLLAQFIKKSGMYISDEYIQQFYNDYQARADQMTLSRNQMSKSTPNGCFNQNTNSPQEEFQPKCSSHHHHRKKNVATLHAATTSSISTSNPNSPKLLPNSEKMPAYLNLFFDSPSAPFGIHSFCSEIEKLNRTKPGKVVSLPTLSLVIKNLLGYSGIETVIADHGQISIPLVLEALEKHRHHHHHHHHRKIPHLPMRFQNISQPLKKFNASHENDLLNENESRPVKTNENDIENVPDDTAELSLQREVMTVPPQQFVARSRISANTEDFPPILLLIPLTINVLIDNELSDAITRALSLSDISIGVIGSKKNHSNFLIGYTDKNEFLYFDPHEVRDAIVSPADSNKCFEPGMHKVKKNSFNSSIMIGFIIRTESDIELIKETMSGTIITVMDEIPLYTSGTKESEFATQQQLQRPSTFDLNQSNHQHSYWNKMASTKKGSHQHKKNQKNNHSKPTIVDTNSEEEEINTNDNETFDSSDDFIIIQ